MWDVPSYRIRAYLRTIRNSTSNTKRTQPVIHVKRIEAEIRITDGFRNGFGTSSIVIPARVILNDLTAKSIRIYCDRPLYPGQKISISIKAPRAMYMRGEVRYCQNVSYSNRIISETPYHYRLGVEFTFTTLSEQESISEFSGRVHNEELRSRHGV